MQLILEVWYHVECYYWYTLDPDFDVHTIGALAEVTIYKTDTLVLLSMIL